MNPLAKLDQLNLNPAAKSEVEALIQSLLHQADRDAALLQSQDAAIKAKEATIQAKDFKIEALTHELAY